MSPRSGRACRSRTTTRRATGCAAACTRFAELWAKIDAEQPDQVAAAGLPGQPAAGGPAPRAPQAPSTRRMRLIAVLHRGWPAGDADLDDYLSRLGDDEWRTKVAEAADLPTGMAADPRLLTVTDLYRGPEPPGAPMALVLAASGLRRQAHGNDAAFVEDLRVGLSLLREPAPLRPPAQRGDRQGRRRRHARRCGLLAKQPERPARFTETSSPFSPIT